MDLKEARALLAEPEIAIEQVAVRLKVPASTLSCYLPGESSVVQDTAGTSK